MRVRSLALFIAVILMNYGCSPDDRDVCLYHEDCPPCYKCNNGSCEIDESQLNACGGCGEVSEICDNNQDDDCDGLTDEGCGDPCDGVVCENPPDPECIDAGTLRVFTSPGQCQDGSCVYAFEDVTCPDGCENDACLGDPCQDVVCDSPPNECYQPTGTCANGVCSYAYLDGAMCSDGDPCTINDACSAGSCAGNPKQCVEPPEDTCSQPDYARVYEATGECVDGTCVYDYDDEYCPNGCWAGECIPTGSDLAAHPFALDFGEVVVGCGYESHYVQISNLGQQSVTIDDIYLQTVDSSYSLFGVPALPNTLTVGGNFAVSVRFHPAATGNHDNALVIEFGAEELIVPLSGAGVAPADATDVFHTPEVLPVDVLFVMENSGSMAMRQADIVAAAGEFIRQAQLHSVDFHIGVIATEVNQTETNVGDPPRDIIPGALVQAPGRPRILENTTPDLASAFSENLNLGSCCSDEQEAGLQAAWMSMTPPLINDENSGFFRDDARLNIIAFGDEDDQSEEDPDYYLGYFDVQYPGGGDWMMVSAVNGELPDGCGDYVTAAPRYNQAVEETDGLFRSICTDDFTPVMAALAKHAFRPPRFFFLSENALESSIQVTVNDNPVPQAGSPGGADGWTYLAGENAVWFGDSVVPPFGATVVVRFTAICGG